MGLGSEKPMRRGMTLGVNVKVVLLVNPRFFLPIYAQLFLLIILIDPIKLFYPQLVRVLPHLNTGRFVC